MLPLRLSTIDPWTVTLTLLGVVTLLTALYIASIRYRTGLRKVPGPFAASILPFDRMLSALRGDQHQQHQDYHRRYGKLVRVGPNHVSISAGQVITQIYGIGSKFKKSDYYILFDIKSHLGLIPSIFSIRDDTAHRAMKRNIASAYSMSTLVDLEPFTDFCIKIFMRKMREHQDQIIDLGEWLQWYAFDVITSLTFSNCMGFMEREEDISGIIRSLEYRQLYNSAIGEAPWLHQFLLGGTLTSWIISFLPGATKLHASQHAVAFAARQVERYKTREPKENELKDMLARFRRGANNEIVNDIELLRHASSNVFAGSDTTAISLRAMVYFLSRTPSAYNKLVEEIKRTPLSDPVTYAEASRMVYLQACMKEAMRLHPAVGQLLERVVPREGTTIDGIWFPGGTIVGVNPWVVARDKDVYGTDADEYKPDRWLATTPEQHRLMERNYLAFGMGARLCLGKNISLLEMSKLIPQLLREFDIVWANPEQDWTLKDNWFVRQSGVFCQLTVRQERLY